MALAPYETPGTQAFADAVLPFVRKHNTVLLANHGIVCWADTVTHAEWYAEVVDTYCWTLMLAAQLGAPDHLHPGGQGGRPPRHQEAARACPTRASTADMKECQLCDLPEMPGAIAVAPPSASGRSCSCGDDVETIVAAVTDAVMAALRK